MMRLRLLLLALAAAVAASSGAAQPAWQVARVPGTTITVELPGTPVYKATNPVSQAGTPFPSHKFGFGDDKRAMMFEVSFWPRDVDVAQPRSTLQAALDVAAKSLKGGKWEKVVWMQYQNAPAAEAFGLFPDKGGFRYRVILKGYDLYLIGVGGLTDELYAPDAERFLNSLRLR